MTPKRILVTGANRGIGFSIIRALADRGKDFIILAASRNLISAQDAISSLREKDLQAQFEAIELDVTSDQSIKACLSYIKKNHGALDVLINNAGIAPIPPSDDPDHTQLRETYSSTLNTNLTSVALLTSLSIPLLLASTSSRVINISSGRASVHALTTGNLPPTVSIPYSISKVALNILGLELAKLYPRVAFYAANPGHCKTALNGFKGVRDPDEGVKVVVELALAPPQRPEVFQPGFWRWDETEGMEKIEW